MTNTIPDRLSIAPESPFYDASALDRGVGIRFNGKERNDVCEYSVSEGWIIVGAGKTLDRNGKPLMIKLKGVVEPYFRS